MKKASAGFTLIELVIVIVILGILAATALPRFIDVSSGAHKAAVETGQGALRSGVMLARAKWYAEGQGTDDVDLGVGPEIGQLNGWITGATNAEPTTDEHCVSVWNAVVDGPQASTGTTEAFQAVRDGASCEYTYQRDTTQPKIVYNTATGTVTLD